MLGETLLKYLFIVSTPLPPGLKGRHFRDRCVMSVPYRYPCLPTLLGTVYTTLRGRGILPGLCSEPSWREALACLRVKSQVLQRGAGRCTAPATLVPAPYLWDHARWSLQGPDSPAAARLHFPLPAPGSLVLPGTVRGLPTTRALTPPSTSHAAFPDRLTEHCYPPPHFFSPLP